MIKVQTKEQTELRKKLLALIPELERLYNIPTQKKVTNLIFRRENGIETSIVMKRIND